MNQPNLSEATLEQLKVAAYDILSQLEILQRNLQIINGEIAKRQEKPVVEEQKEEK